MTADQYLANVLAREAVNTGTGSPILTVQNTLLPILREWGGAYLQDVHPRATVSNRVDAKLPDQVGGLSIALKRVHDPIASS